MNFLELQEAWQSLLAEKTFKYRSQHLPDICRADPALLTKLFLQERTCITTENSLPTKADHGSALMFAARWKRGQCFDVVSLDVSKKRTRYECCVSLFERVEVGLTPRWYFAEPYALAAFGYGESRGGKWGCRWGREPDSPKFIPEVEARIPRLKEYKAHGILIPCVWSMRDPRLQTALAGLKSRSRERRVEAIQEIDGFEWNTDQLPSLSKRIAADGLPAFFDALTVAKTEPLSYSGIRARDLLEKIALQAPELIDDFAAQLDSHDTATQMACVRGLLAVARADRASIPHLMGLVGSNDADIRGEVIKGIERLFHYGECGWRLNGTDQSVEDQQREIVEIFGPLLLNALKTEAQPDLITQTQLTLLRIQKWSPKLKAQITRQCGNIRKNLWPAS